MIRRSDLDPDEWDLWAHVARQTKPLRKRRLRVSAERSVHPGTERPRPSDLVNTGKAPQPPVAVPTATAGTSVRSKLPPLTDIDRRITRRLAKGAIEIDARLDLHGHRQHEAHDQLRAFLRRCHQNGFRTVLVITGKGVRTDRAEGSERGVLKRLVPIWLATPDLRSIVLGFDEAHVRHGGNGALYVRLRRER
jgi:DNA-nicking Smr family endonuclease